MISALALFLGIIILFGFLYLPLKFGILSFLGSQSVDYVIVIVLVNIIGILLVVVGLGNLLGFIKKKKCQICSDLGKDSLSSEKTIGTFCRKHLILRYSELFLRSHFHLVMLEYQPDGISYPGYLYYPLSEIDWGGNQKEIIQELINGIRSKKCVSCDDSTSILFISKELAPFKKFGPEPQNNFSTKGLYLCKKHALEKALPSIKNSKKDFNIHGGLYLPFKENGYQSTIQW